MRRYEHSEMSDITDFASADKRLHDRYGKPVNSRKVGNNTYLERHNVNGETVAIAVRLHATDVVRFFPNGHTELNTGGWFTVTTKDRINKWIPAPFSVFSKRGSWMVSLSWKTVTHERKHKAHAYQDWQSKKWRYYPSGIDTWQSKEVACSVPFFDGITLDSKTGTVVNGSKVPDEKARDKRNAKTRKAIKRYVDAYTDQCIKGLLEAANVNGTGGDCWYCSLQTNDGKTMGDVAGDNSHLRTHISEQYVMASLLYNAVKASGYRDPAYIMHYAPDMARRALSKYLRKRLLEATMVNH